MLLFWEGFWDHSALLSVQPHSTWLYRVTTGAGVLLDSVWRESEGAKRTGNHMLICTRAKNRRVLWAHDLCFPDSHELRWIRIQAGGSMERQVIRAERFYVDKKAKGIEEELVSSKLWPIVGCRSICLHKSSLIGMYTNTLPPQRGHLVSGEPCGAWWALLCGLVELGSWVDTVGLDLFCGAPLFIRLCLNDHHWIQNTQVYKDDAEWSIYTRECTESGTTSEKKYFALFSFKIDTNYRIWVLCILLL